MSSGAGPAELVVPTVSSGGSENASQPVRYYSSIQGAVIMSDLGQGTETADDAYYTTTISVPQAEADTKAPVENEQLIYVIFHHESWPGLAIERCKLKSEVKGVIANVFNGHAPETWADISVKVIYGVELNVGAPRMAVVVELDGKDEVLFKDRK